MIKIDINILFSEKKCTIYYNDKYFKITYDEINPSIVNDLYLFILSSFKLIFNDLCDVYLNYKCDISKGLSSNQINLISAIINNVALVMSNTQKEMKKLTKNEFIDYHQILFFGLSDRVITKPELKIQMTDQWFDTFFSAHGENNSEVLFYNFPSDSIFDSVKRRWIKTNVVYTVEQLMNFFRDKQIKKIVFQNNYLYETFLKTQNVYLPAILDYVGIEGIGADYDPSEYSEMFMEKALFNIKDHKRFNPYPTYEESWDTRFDLTNVTYSVFLNHYDFQPGKNKLRDDYSIVVLSNSRIGFVIKEFYEILFVASNLDEENIFRDFQLWGLAMRELIQNRLNHSDIQKIRFSNKVLRIFYHVGQFLKYEVLEMLCTNRSVKIYGDKGWKVVFPEYYQNRFLNKEEISELFCNDTNLLLGFNQGVDYLQASGPVVDSLTKNIPFINFPAIAKASEFKGFEAIEYRNIEELNQKANNAENLYDNKQLNNSRDCYRELLCESEKMIAEYIFQNRNFTKDENKYYKVYKEHQKILTALVNEYIEKHEIFLKKSFDILLLKTELDHNIIKKTRFSERNYFRRIKKEMGI